LIPSLAELEFLRKLGYGTIFGPPRFYLYRTTDRALENDEGEFQRKFGEIMILQDGG